MSKKYKATWYVSTASATTCGVLRGDLPACVINKAEDSDWEVEIKTAVPFFSSDLINPPKVAVFQRDLDSIAVMGLLKQKGVKLVYDIDDALWNLPDSKEHAEFSLFGIHFNKLGRDRLQESLKLVDCITCSTPELVEALRDWMPEIRKKLVYLENGVDSYYFPFFPNFKKEAFDVLWYGAMGHNHNSYFLVEVAKQALDTIPNCVFHLLGSVKDFDSIKELVKLYPNRVKTHEWLPYGNLGLFISMMDTVLCPIVEHPFTICKSEIKALEASACGRFPVMSAVPQYERFGRRILTGKAKSMLLLANEPARWAETLQKLAAGEQPMPIEQLVERTLNKYNIDRPAKRWDTLFNSLVGIAS